MNMIQVMAAIFVPLVYSDDSIFSRDAKTLLYSSGSIYQISIGISIANDVKPNSGQVSIGFQQNLRLPINTTELGLLRPEFARSITGDASPILDYIQQLLESYGYDQECLLRVICDLAKTPFVPGGLMEDILYLILTPSLHLGMHSSLLNAEYLGINRGNCSSVYSSCPEHPLAQFLG